MMWAALGLGGLLVVVTGWLPGAQAREVALTRGGPVLGFLVAITLLATLADRAGVFDYAAALCARAGRGSTFGLFLLIAVLGSLTTIGMSLDTTAVLLTPVVLSLATQLGLRPLPFAMLAVWLANTASMLLPVSNLTNLLAVQRVHLSTASFARQMSLVEVAAILISVGYLATLYRGDLRGRYELPAAAVPADRVTFWTCAVACTALAPGVLLGVAPWLIGSICASAAVVAFLLRGASNLDWSMLPWRIVIGVEGLFLIVAAIARHGLTTVLSHAAGQSDLQTTAVSAIASNAVNNLPAYLAVEPAIPAGHPRQLLAALIGTNAGPLVLLWGSLATLLWNERCRQRGLRVSAVRFAAVGLGGVPLVLLGCWAALEIAN